jgi:rubrerythrin
MEEKLKAIEIALQNESNERDFYRKQSERTADPLGKQMFATLAREEEEHYRYLKELHRELAGQGRWPETISAVIGDTNVKKVLNEMVDKVHYDTSATADDTEAVRIAVDFETKGYQFYTSLSQKAEHPDEKALFERLASLELEHLSSLKETLEYFENPADWFAQQEKPHFEA